MWESVPQWLARAAMLSAAAAMAIGTIDTLAVLGADNPFSWHVACMGAATVVAIVAVLTRPHGSGEAREVLRGRHIALGFVALALFLLGLVAIGE
jgi:hypothetical protein